METGNLGVLGRLAAQNTQISDIFPFPQVEGKGSSKARFGGWGCPPLNQMEEGGR